MKGAGGQDGTTASDTYIPSARQFIIISLFYCGYAKQNFLYTYRFKQFYRGLICSCFICARAYLL